MGGTQQWRGGGGAAAIFNPLSQSSLPAGSLPAHGLFAASKQSSFYCPTTFLLLEWNHFLPFLLQCNGHFLGFGENI